MEFNNLPELKKYISLIPQKERDFVALYMRWYKLLSLRGLHQKNVHQKTFNYLYKAVSREWSENRLLGKLQKEFIARNLSLSLLLEPLDGFDWVSKNRYTLTLSKATPILLQLISPIARLITILNNEKPPLYQPFSNLIFAYAVLYTLNSPQAQKVLENSSLKTEPQQLQAQLPLLLKESKQALSVISGFVFKLRIAYFVALANCLTKKYTMHAKNKINFLDFVNVILYGLWYSLTTKNKTSGLNKL